MQKFKMIMLFSWIVVAVAHVGYASADNEQSSRMQVLNALSSQNISEAEIVEFVDVIMSGELEDQPIPIGETVEFIDTLDETQIELLGRALADYSNIDYDEFMADADDSDLSPTAVMATDMSSSSKSSVIVWSLLTVVCVVSFVWSRNRRGLASLMLLCILFSGANIVVIANSSYDEGQVPYKYTAAESGQSRGDDRWEDNNCDSNPNDSDWIIHHTGISVNNSSSMKWKTSNSTLYAVFFVAYNGGKISVFGFDSTEARLCLGSGALRGVGYGSVQLGARIVQSNLLLVDFE